MSRTTLDIDDKLVHEAMSKINARTKTEVVEAGLRELIRKANRELLRKKLGTFTLGISTEDLWRMRHER